MQTSLLSHHAASHDLATIMRQGLKLTSDSFFGPKVYHIGSSCQVLAWLGYVKVQLESLVGSKLLIVYRSGSKSVQSLQFSC